MDKRLFNLSVERMFGKCLTEKRSVVIEMANVTGTDYGLRYCRLVQVKKMDYWQFIFPSDASILDARDYFLFFDFHLHSNDNSDFCEVFDTMTRMSTSLLITVVLAVIAVQSSKLQIYLASFSPPSWYFFFWKSAPWRKRRFAKHHKPHFDETPRFADRRHLDETGHFDFEENSDSDESDRCHFDGRPHIHGKRRFNHRPHFNISFQFNIIWYYNASRNRNGTNLFNSDCSFDIWAGTLWF